MTDTWDDDLAAEYVLGALGLGERAQAEARLKTDAGFAAQVMEWQNRLSGLNDDYAEMPAPHLLPQIEARLFPVRQRPARRWFGWLAGAGAAAALLVVFALPQPQAPLLATIAGDALSYEARYDGATLTVSRLAGTQAAAGQVHQLWIIAPGAAPVSLGLLADGDLTVTTQAPKGWTLAISLEPAGGSATGAPTGPVLAAIEIGV